MMTSLGRFTVRRRKAILAVSAVAFVVAAALGAGVIDRLSSGGFEDLGSESAHALAFLEKEFGAGEVDLVLLVTARSGDVDDRPTTRAALALTEQLAREPDVTSLVSYWRDGRLPPLRGKDGDKALILVGLEGSRDDVTRRLDTLIPAYEGSEGALDVRATGFGAVFREASRQIEKDLRRAELIVFPLTALLLLFVFRSAVASALPLAVGGLAVVGTLFALRVIASFTEVSVYALNMTIAMSLGLGVDYSLFIVSRFREEVAAGASTDEAVVRSVATAGRTVAFSAVTVAASLVALIVFPLAFLRSFGFAGIALVVTAGAASVVTLPAILATLGPRVERWSVRRRPAAATGTGAWHRIAMGVMRRPVPVATVATLFLLVLGLPALRMELGAPDPRTLPEDAPARKTVEVFNENFAGGEGFPIFVLARDVTLRRADVHRYAAALSTVPGVARVDAWTGSYAQGARLFADARLAAQFAKERSTYLRIVPAPSIPAFMPRAEQLVAEIAATPAPFDRPVQLTGQTPAFIDAKEALFDRLPLALAMIGIATFVVLFLAFGSLLVPVKAIVLNLLSLTATFGAMVWIFQDGHLSGLLQFTPREAVDVFNPVLMFAIAFGISMDYEVFMLSRIREEYERTGDNTGSVAMGLERTGGLVTAAAVLLAVVFLAQVSSGISIIKMFGLGLALAILIDAFVVRAALVPAFMRLAGRLNWWLPEPLRRLHDRVGFREHDDVIVLEPPATETAAATTTTGRNT